ncbi:hypothetical protein ACWGS5_25205 [Streptomyces albidoflavus]|uniref:hypothetical protein n=1 Tax=Streptomyces TaxID=1883 RepID=UPI0012FE8EFD|nr:MULTISPECIES: hypothetical protein [Streptomyces]MBV1956387.1 hypothetical protein [Streptomyces sp. BV333]UYX96154.1 hypothetical protein OIM89_21635 [Streptomyces sp. BI87]
MTAGWRGCWAGCGLSGPLVTAARPARDISPEAHRYAFATWYASVTEPVPVAGRLYEQAPPRAVCAGSTRC